MDTSRAIVRGRGQFRVKVIFSLNQLKITNEWVEKWNVRRETWAVSRETWKKQQHRHVWIAWQRQLFHHDMRRTPIRVIAVSHKRLCLAGSPRHIPYTVYNCIFPPNAVVTVITEHKITWSVVHISSCLVFFRKQSRMVHNLLITHSTVLLSWVRLYIWGFICSAETSKVARDNYGIQQWKVGNWFHCRQWLDSKWISVLLFSICYIFPRLNVFIAWNNNVLAEESNLFTTNGKFYLLDLSVSIVRRNTLVALCRERYAFRIFGSH